MLCRELTTLELARDASGHNRARTPNWQRHRDFGDTSGGAKGRQKTSVKEWLLSQVAMVIAGCITHHSVICTVGGLARPVSWVKRIMSLNV